MSEDNFIVSDDLEGRIAGHNAVEDNMMNIVVIYDDRAVVGAFRYLRREKNVAEVEMRIMLDTLFQELEVLEDVARRHVKSFEVHRGDTVVYSIEDASVQSFGFEDVDYENMYAKFYLRIEFDVETDRSLLTD
jgi:hypothetical protein